MSFIINNNAFSADDPGKRSTRLNFLSKSITDYEAELAISGEMFNWALNSFDIYLDILSMKDVQKGIVSESVQTYQENFQELRKKYQNLKNIIISRYADNPEKLVIFSVEGMTPITMDGLKFHWILRELWMFIIC